MVCVTTRVFCVNYNPLIEVYPYTPFPPSQPQGFSDYTLEPSGWTPPTRADAKRLLQVDHELMAMLMARRSQPRPLCAEARVNRDEGVHCPAEAAGMDGAAPARARALLRHTAFRSQGVGFHGTDSKQGVGHHSAQA